MMRGDQYPLAFRITNPENFPQIESVKDIEVMIGCIRKKMSDGDVAYDTNEHLVSVHLTQAETFSLTAGTVEYQIRFVLANGDVYGKPPTTMYCNRSLSEEVL